MTATTAINSTAAANTGTNKAKSNTLGKNEFFKILAAQLQNQDPINPASNTEFVANWHSSVLWSNCKPSPLP
jgi:flagellar hook assembly protein FlgD